VRRKAEREVLDRKDLVGVHVIVFTQNNLFQQIPRCQSSSKPHLRGAGMKTALAAFTGEMLVAVDESRRDGQTFGIDDVDFSRQACWIDMFRNVDDPAATNQYVPLPRGDGV
jgi:hypothetical protein